MTRARAVENLNCADALSAAAARILAVRLNELRERQGAIGGPEDSVALHDLRIAAKRLRYSLEMFALCFPPKQAESFADRVREMQDTLGRLHDLDVLHALLGAELERMDETRRRRELEVAGQIAEETERSAALRRMMKDRKSEAERLGLLEVIAAKLQERQACYDRYRALWSEWDENGLLDEIGAMIAS